MTRFGDAAYRLDLPAGVDRAALQEALRAHPGVTDALVTDRHVLVCFPPGSPPSGLDEILATPRTRATEPRRHVVRVRYDGPDLADVARALDLPESEVISRHAGREYEVQLVGFLPGFAYLGPLEEVLAKVPRRPSPRPRVPALSVAIAAGRTAVYPFQSPGGWQLLGTAIDVVPFDAGRGALFRLGDRVVFEPA